MPDAKQKEGKEKNPHSPEKQPEKGPAGFPEQLAAIKSAQKEQKEETTGKTSDIRREMLETEVVGADRESAELIATLDTNLEIAEQGKKWERLEFVCWTLLPKLFDKGFKKEVLRILDSFRSIQIPEDISLNGVEKVALKKLKQIASQSNSPLFNDIEKKWGDVITKSHNAYKKAAEARDYINAPAPAPGESAEKEPWLIRKMKEYPVITALCLGTAAYHTYKIFFADKSTPEGQQQQGLLDKIGLGGWKKKLLMVVLGALALGGLIGYDKIGAAIKKISNISMESIEKAWELLKQGKLTAALAALVSGGGELLEEGIEKGKEALKWVDEQIHFTEFTKEVKELANKYGITMPDWLKNIDLKEIAKEMGLSFENKADWMEFAGVGGSAYLIYKFTGKKGIILKEMGLFLLLVKSGKEGFGGKIFSFLGKEFDEAKDFLIKKMKANDSVGSIADALIPDVFANFSIQNHIDDLLDWMKENPILAMGAINGLWFGRHIILSALKKAILGVGKTAKAAVTHPKTTFVVTGILALEFARRRFVIEDLIKALYDDPGSKEAIAMRDSLGSLVGVNFAEKPGLGEYQADDFHKSLLEDPKKALEKLTNIDAYKQGGFAIFLNSSGVLYYLAKGASAPVQLAKLSWESFKSLSRIYSPEYEGGVLWPTVIAGMEGFVFGSMAWEGFKAYKTLFTSQAIEVTRGARLWRRMKSLVPLTKEWWFIVKSCGTGIPGWQTISRLTDRLAINRMTRQLEQIKELAEKKPAGFAQKIQDIAMQIKREPLLAQSYGEIMRNLSRTNFQMEIAKNLDRVKKNLDDIENNAAGVKTQNLERVKELADMNIQKLEEVKTGSAGMIKRFNQLMRGEFKEAMSGSQAAADLKLAGEEAAKAAKEGGGAKPGAEGAKTKPGAEAEAAKPVDMKGATFRNPDGSFKSMDEMNKSAENFRKEIAALDDANPLKKAKSKELAAIEAFTDPGRISAIKVERTELAKLDDAARAAKVESLAAQLESAEKGMQSRFNFEVDKIVKEAKAAGIELTDPTVIEKLEKLDREITIPLAKNKQAVFEALNKEFKALPRELRKSPSLIAQLNHAREGIEGTLMTRFVKGAKGRAKMMVLMASLIFASDQIIHRNDPERELAKIVNDIGPELGQLLLDVLPVAGTFSNYYSAFSGREIVTDRDVSGTWDRISNAIWGTVGLAGDTLAVMNAVPTGGGSMMENVEIRLAKAAKSSRAAKKLLKVWPKLASIADRMGGVKNFAEKVAKYVKMDPGKLAKGLRTVEAVGMAAGTVMVVGGTAYHLRYAFVDTKKEIDIAPELLGEKPLEAPTPPPA